MNYEYVRDATSFSQVLLCLNLRRLKGTPCGYEDLLNKDKIFSCLSIVGGYGDTPSCGVNVNEPRLASLSHQCEDRICVDTGCDNTPTKSLA